PEFLEPFFDHRDFVVPFISVEFDRVDEVVFRDFQAGQVQCILGWDDADWSIDAFAFSLETLNNPLQDTSVLAEAWPRDITGVIAAEPVDQASARTLVS